MVERVARRKLKRIPQLTRIIPATAALQTTVFGLRGRFLRRALSTAGRLRRLKPHKIDNDPQPAGAHKIALRERKGAAIGHPHRQLAKIQLAP